jgi:hypothetical protein
LKAWLDVLGFSRSTAIAKLTEPIFMSLVDPLAPGACAKCHSIDRVDEALIVNWQPTRANEATSFNRFSHTTHFSLSAGEACNRCHALNREADVLSSFKEYDPQNFASGFADIPKKLCAECHTSTRAGDACIQCHTYHVGKPEPVLPATRIEESVAGR